MRRSFALAIGGFDEDYVIGDFEDSDLCLKIHQAGRLCAVDQDVRLYHLERKSQATSGNRWRQNMTLYNAWRHQRRWATELSGMLRPASVNPRQPARIASYG
jgi:GT2 family glycosyltransferase